MNDTRLLAIAGLETDLAPLKPLFENAQIPIRWLDKDPLDWQNPDMVDPVPNAAAADTVIYVLSPECCFSTQLKVHFGYVNHLVKAKARFFLPVRGADVHTESTALNFLQGTPTIGLDALRMLVDGQPASGISQQG